MGLLDSLKLKEIDEFCIRLAVPGRLRAKLVTARKTGVIAMRRLARGGLKDSELYHLLKPLQMEALLYITAKGGDGKEGGLPLYYPPDGDEDSTERKRPGKELWIEAWP